MSELLSVDVRTLSDRQFADHLAELTRVRQQLSAVELDRLRVFEATAAFDVDAARNTTSWLVEQTGVARAEAASRTRLALFLPQMPLTQEALAAGRITESHAKVLSRCVANPRVREFFSGRRRPPPEASAA